MRKKQAVKGRLSARKKAEAVLRLPRGEELDVLSRALGVTAGVSEVQATSRTPSPSGAPYAVVRVCEEWGVARSIEAVRGEEPQVRSQNPLPGCRAHRAHPPGHRDFVFQRRRTAPRAARVVQDLQRAVAHGAPRASLAGRQATRVACAEESNLNTFTQLSRKSGAVQSAECRQANVATDRH